MKLNVNPILEFTSMDRTIMKKTYAMCENLISMLAMYTITDDACITCADNGEVFVTEKELYEVLDIIGRMIRITDEAPCDSDDSIISQVRKILAINFEDLFNVTK